MEPSKFWREVEAAYRQVAADHEREISIFSNSEDLTAAVRYDTIVSTVVITIFDGTNEREVEADA